MSDTWRQPGEWHGGGGELAKQGKVVHKRLVNKINATNNKH